MLRSLVAILFLSLIVGSACQRRSSGFVTVALPETFSSLDTLTSTSSDAAAERVRNLMFNSLVRKNESFDYIGELASEIQTSDDGLSLIFKLRSGVKFHNGKEFTSADVKYTFDRLFDSKGYKSGAFFDTVPLAAGEESAGPGAGAAKTKQVAHVTRIETPDAETVIFGLYRAGLKNQLLSNLVAIPIIPEGTSGEQGTSPIGSGPFKFANFDQSQNTVDLEANEDYWEGAPSIAKLRVKTITDASALQSELQSGAVDIAPVPSNLPPDSLKVISSLSGLRVEQFDGSNIQYIGLNTASPPLDNVKVRQAIGYAIDREKIIKELLSGQARIANSILPESSWAFTPGTVYNYDPEKARELLKESGYKNEPIKFKFSAGNAAFSSYAQAIHSTLLDVGLNVQIETLDPTTLRQQLAQGQFQLNTGVWIGGNQDPLFLKDLFTTGRIPGEGVSCCNRSRYSNGEVDRIVDSAINEPDKGKAKALYQNAWEMISRDAPLLPLWYPANMVVARDRVQNIKIGPSGDWSFIKDITVSN